MCEKSNTLQRMVELLGIINQNQGANIVHSVLTCIFLWSLQVRYDTGGYGAVMLWYSTGPVWEWVRFGTVWVDQLGMDIVRCGTVRAQSGIGRVQKWSGILFRSSTVKALNMYSLYRSA